MITIERLLEFDKNDLQEECKKICGGDLSQLVEWLSEKDDTIRYQAFLLLQHRSMSFDDVYPFWDIFRNKLKSDNSYQRSIGLMLIADNAKWDTENKLDDTIHDYLLILNDEKPITVRQCLQSLCKIVPCKNYLLAEIANKIMSIDLYGIKETMRKLILIDMLNVLAVIRKQLRNDEIDSYIFNALSGGLLDKKAIKQIESAM
jgi:hypothetical protein